MNIITKFQALSICFADTLTLFEYLVKNSILQDQNGGPCALNQSAVYIALFSQHFDAHDALEDVKALRRILFASKLNLSTRDLLNYCKPIPFNDAYHDSLYLCKRNELTETFASLLHDNSDGKSTISKCMVEKIAGSSLSYTNLKDIFDKFGRKGLVRALSTLPPGFKKPRVTKTKRILLAIVHHFEASHQSNLCSHEQ